MVLPTVMLAPVTVRVREVVPPATVKPSEAEVRVRPLYVPPVTTPALLTVKLVALIRLVKLLFVPVNSRPLIVPLVPATERFNKSVVLPVLVGASAAIFKPEAVLPAAAPEFCVKASFK